MRQLITLDGLFGASVQMRDTVMIALNIEVRILTAQNKWPSISLSFPTPIFDVHRGNEKVMPFRYERTVFVFMQLHCLFSPMGKYKILKIL